MYGDFRARGDDDLAIIAANARRFGVEWAQNRGVLQMVLGGRNDAILAALPPATKELNTALDAITKAVQKSQLSG